MKIKISKRESFPTEKGDNRSTNPKKTKPALYLHLINFKNVKWEFLEFNDRFLLLEQRSVSKECKKIINKVTQSTKPLT